MGKVELREPVFPGLRNSDVVFLLEAGYTDAEVCAITGQSRQMVEHYALQANQRKLARLRSRRERMTARKTCAMFL
jgi:hypothetical protein